MIGCCQLFLPSYSRKLLCQFELTHLVSLFASKFGLATAHLRHACFPSSSSSSSSCWMWLPHTPPPLPATKCLSVCRAKGGERGRAAIDRLLTNATMNSNSLSLLLARERGSAHPRHYVHYMLESHAQKCAAQNFFLLWWQREPLRKEIRILTVLTAMTQLSYVFLINVTARWINLLPK